MTAATDHSVHVEPDGTLVITGTDLATGERVTIGLSPTAAERLADALACERWRMYRHPVRDDRPAFDAQDDAQAVIS